MLLRPLLFLGISSLLLLPDWSTARPFRRFRNAPMPVAYSYPAPVAYSPVYSQPVYPPPTYPAFISYPSCCPQPVQACPPVTAPPQGPRVIPERMAEPKAALPKPTTAKPVEPKPVTETPPAPKVIRTVGNEERLPPMQVPLQPRPVADPMPLPRIPGDFAQPKAITGESHKPEVKPDPLPSAPAPVKKIEPQSDLPKFELNPDPVPSVPTPAKKTEPMSDLPKFDLPPLPPLVPPTTVKSSPLNAEPIADVYPLAGPAPADRAAKRRVGFVNKSPRDVILTVGGKMTTLPTGQYLQLNLPAKFAWQLGGEKESVVTVPDTAPGVDVVIRR